MMEASRMPTAQVKGYLMSTGPRMQSMTTIRKMLKQHIHFCVLRCFFLVVIKACSALAVHVFAFSTCTSMASSISPCASTRVATSVNICARSAMLRSKRRMSSCFSRIRWTSSRSMACAPAIFFATTSCVVSPASIISALSSGDASGMRISISRNCRLSSACLKSTCAFWKSKSNCWCFLAIACCMLARILPSALLGRCFSSSSDLDFNRWSPSLTFAKWPLVSCTKACNLSETTRCRSCVVTCRASSKTSPMSFTLPLPSFRVD
mmetsp:Transcript_27081/g.61705  ORF Transcript_27081/g.61705 Transcript_27081/m.61705 type:complete len:265 (-) Transcript_27081:360-1154(-)